MIYLGEQVRSSLEEQLAKAQRQGVIGKAALESHIDHSLAFGSALEPFVEVATRDVDVSILDLGSGGGLPGLVLGAALPHVRVCLVDATQRRVDELRLAAAELGLANVTALHGRAEDLARRDDMRATFSAVVSRSFGPPAVTAECASGFLGVGGVLVVSQPPEPASDRWPAEGLRALGMEVVASPPGFQVIRQIYPCPDRFPRRAGMPTKRPLF